ncbi:MAG: hypothetical protein K2V38_02950, partial [Gemmataceae bacterium]|nr:hypothetical protein [Gemmataceae bacterium]
MRFALPLLVFPALISALPAQPKKPAPTADEQQAVELITKAGGKAEIDARLPAEARVVARFEAATDATLLALRKGVQIGALDAFDATKCTDKGFAVLKDLPHLRKLVLSKSELTKAGATALGQCKELRDLRIPASGLTDAELGNLKGLALLEQFDVSDNPQVTDKGMAVVKGFERLQV